MGEQAAGTIEDSYVTEGMINGGDGIDYIGG